MKRKDPTLRKKNWKAVLKRNVVAYALMLIPLCLFAFYVWYPMIRNFILSFGGDSDSPGFFGFYAAIFGEDRFLAGLKNTFLYILWSLVLGYLVPVLLGFLLSEVIHAKGLFRVLLYLPCMISGMAVTFLFKSIYGDADHDLFNVILIKLGMEPHPWRGSISLVIPLIVLAMTWKGAGSTALIYLSAFQSIDDSMYEAARMDGASAWQRFWRITIPALRGTMLTLFVLQIISVFQVFYEPLIIGPFGGPLNGSMSLMLLSYLYAFQDFNFGKSAACSMILGLIIVAFTLVYSLVDRFLKKKEGRA